MSEQKNNAARTAAGPNGLVERLALTAGFADGREGLWWGGLETLERFAALVAEAQREASAKVCENFTVVPELSGMSLSLAAAEIRASPLFNSVGLTAVGSDKG